jgi:hypothetical protein
LRVYIKKEKAWGPIHLSSLPEEYKSKEWRWKAPLSNYKKEPKQQESGLRDCTSEFMRKNKEKKKIRNFVVASMSLTIEEIY